MAYKGKQSLAKVAPNHPFAKPQIGFVPRPRSASAPNATPEVIEPVDWDAALGRTLARYPSTDAKKAPQEPSASSRGTTPPNNGKA